MPDQRRIIEELRERIQRLERRPPRSDRLVESGTRALDALLGGGFPCGALVELCGTAGSGKTELALRAVARATADGALAAYVDARAELYAPAALALGVALDRLLIVRPEHPGPRLRRGGSVREALWAAEALLASGAFAVVVVDVPLAAGARLHGEGASAEAMLRRLRAAAEKGGTAGVWLGEPGASRVPGAPRLEVTRGAEGPRVRRAGALERASHAA